MTRTVWLLGERGSDRARVAAVLADWDISVQMPFPEFDAQHAPELCVAILGERESMSELLAYTAWREAFRVPLFLILGASVSAEARAWLSDEETHPRLPRAETADLAQSDEALRTLLRRVLGAENPSRTQDGLAWRERFVQQCGYAEVGDYFRILGLGIDAHAGQLREAYARQRKDFDPKTARFAQPADLEALRQIRELLDEAYAILRDPVRRERYRAALRGRDAEQDEDAL